MAGPAAGRTAQGCGNGGGTGGTRHQRDSDDLAAVISLHRAFPDIDVIVADMFTEQDKVVTRVIARGTHLGPLPHIAPSARRTAVMGHEIWRVANGQILEHWGRFEDLDLLQQLGVLPAQSVPA